MTLLETSRDVYVGVELWVNHPCLNQASFSEDDEVTQKVEIFS